MFSRAIKGLLFLFVIVPFLKGAPCVANSLATDIALGSCTVGNVTFEDYGFQLVSSTGITLPISASQITVTPDASGTGLDFSSASLFQLNASQSVNLAITYELAAPGISQFESSLGSPVLTPGGSISIDESLCLGSAFNLGVCAGSTTSLDLLDDGGTQTLSGSALFPGESILGVQDGVDISEAMLQSIKNSSGSVQSIPPAPEPYSILLCFSGLMILGWRLNRTRLVVGAIGEDLQDRAQDACATPE
jgi:hypothetical protein